MNERDKIQAIIEAQQEIIGWYETESERSNYEDFTVPDDLAELEQKLIAARNITVDAPLPGLNDALIWEE